MATREGSRLWHLWTFKLLVMKRLFIIFVLGCLPIVLHAQNSNDDFQAFRKKMHEGFQGFRKGILDDYAQFLEGIWEDYEVFTGRKRNLTPKPDVQPVRKEDEPQPEPQVVEPEEVKPAEPVKQEDPPMPKPVVTSPSSMISFDWCGMKLQLPDAQIGSDLGRIDKDNLVAYFDVLQNSKLETDVLPQLQTIANALNLNDWCLHLVIQSYVKQLKTNSNTNTRNIICWYMMALWGYDVRISLNGNNLFYLIPFQQTVYGRNYITINDIPYYIFGEGKTDNNEGFCTPKVPDAQGSRVNLVLLKPLKIPYKAKHFSHTFKDRTLNVDVNENLIKVMSQFPQIPIAAYALSAGDNKARSQVLTQMKQFTNGMNELEAANFILQFIQSFDYATDGEQFGYEKPFFVEEILYYPKNDCEDRSIFYYYIMTQLFNKDVHLVTYPGHECTGVHFSQDLRADCYYYGGKQYVICDPTYIGANIGMCMPEFLNVKPEIELAR